MIDRRIKFRHIQCFVEIARLRSFKQAAEALFLTQPAISKTLKELEDIVGEALLLRSRSGVELTKSGEVFLHFAQMSLASLQQGLDRVEREGRAEKEQLSIGALPSVTARILPRAAAKFSELAPDAMLRIVDGPLGYLTDRLKLGELDLVLGRLGTSSAMDGVSFTQLYNEEVVFVVRPGHPLLDAPSLERVRDWQVIFPPHGSAIRPLVDRFLVSQGFADLPNRLETVSGAFGRNYVPMSDAVWIISGGVVERQIADGTLVRVPIETDLTLGPVGFMARPGEVATSTRQIFELAVRTAIRDAGLA